VRSAYASGFSGFYLPLMMVLWLLILRGTAVEFRNHIVSPVWAPLWDVVFAGASTLLALFFGAALGNVLRGIPIDANGNFFLPLWTNFRLGPDPGILDWFTITLGVASVAALAMHGALWVVMKADGAPQQRARNIARRSWLAVVLLTFILVLIVPLIRPQFAGRYAAHPWGLVFPIFALAGLMLILFMAATGPGCRVRASHQRRRRSGRRVPVAVFQPVFAPHAAGDRPMVADGHDALWRRDIQADPYASPRRL